MSYHRVSRKEALSFVAYDEYQAAIPWANRNYMNAPGGIRFMADWIARFWETRWQLFNQRNLPDSWPVIARYPEQNQDLSQVDAVYGSRHPLFVFFGIGMHCPTVRSASWTATDDVTGDRFDLNASNIYGAYDCHLIRLDPAQDWPEHPFTVTIDGDLPTWDLEIAYTLETLPEL